MCARNFLSARDKNTSKIVDTLPNINHQKFNYRNLQELPSVLPSNNSNFVNRNLSYSYEVQPYVEDNLERSGTPFSDFFSGSETGTPDFRSEESDSSAGSILRRNTAETTKFLTEEWEKIERTLYDEEGEKSNRSQIIEECKQWRHIHPQLRIVGKAIPLPDKRLSCRNIDHEEVIAVHYSDYEGFSESEERLSQSSADITPQNSPRVSFSEDLFEPKLSREKVYFNSITYEEEPNLPSSFCSLLQITPIQIRSPLQKKRQGSSILKSEIASSRWMRTSRPDSSVDGERNSAKSFASLDIRNSGNFAMSASERKKMVGHRILTARQRDITRLEPLYTPDFQNGEPSISHTIGHNYAVRKVSLPPLLLQEEKKKVTVNSAKRYNKVKKNSSKHSYQYDKVKNN